MFCALVTTTNESFERTVEVVKEKWILGDATCTVAYVIKTYNSKYRNFEGSNVWNKSGNKDTKIIDLTTALNHQRMKFEEFQNNYNKNGDNKITPNENNLSGNPGGNNSKLRVPEWRVKFKGNTATFDGNKWDRCKHHMSEGLFEGMYMPHPRNHDKWKQKRNEWNDNRINQRKLKARNKTGQTSATSKQNKLTLSKSLSTALATKLGVSNVYESRIIEYALKEAVKD